MVKMISIHAPAKGATCLFIVISYFVRFQSTLPRRERLPACILSVIDDVISIHAPAKGATPKPQRIRPKNYYFNPRSREGSDGVYFVTQATSEKISIHAPAKGATYGGTIFRVQIYDFNPRSREGSDPHTQIIRVEGIISIHAPAKGATDCYITGVKEGTISIHAPAKGATINFLQLTYTVFTFQSTLPRRERHNCWRCRKSFFMHFNPRSREGSDLLVRCNSRTSDDFNPRSREGSDFRVLFASTDAELFQSTLPRRERRKRRCGVAW